MATLLVFAVSPTLSRSAESVVAPAIRWHGVDGLPVRVWVQPAPGGASSAARFSDNVRAAFMAWSSVAPMAFDFASDSATADVRVYSSQHSLLSPDGSAVDALTHAEVDESARIVRAEIVLALQTRMGRPLSAEALNALAIHEVGHAIGLEHSADSSSIMFSTVRVSGLSPKDLATVRALYGERTPDATALSP